MRHFIGLSDLKKEEALEIFRIADEIKRGKYKGYLQGKTIVMFFPASSIRTRVTFEKGIYLLGGQSILFTSDTLDKKEDMKDVMGYLNNWADGVIVRHKDIRLLDQMYALSKMRDKFTKDKFLFVGPAGNIGYAWKEASELMNFSLEQCCPNGYEIKGIGINRDLKAAIIHKDIICTDSLSEDKIGDFKDFQITLDHMKMANKNAILNPCPPFYRGEEVAEDVIDSCYFVGYDFKKPLLEIQQAILIYFTKKF